MTYQEALTYIHSVCWKGSVPGLSRTRELLGRIGNPQNKLKFVHIAGTNGKGSTAAMLASVFRSAGYHTGLYTSPFILCFNERMQVDGEMISDEELAEITEFVRPHAEAMADHPTEFELVTVIAMEYFMRHGCDIVSLEVGLGGELDSTNVIDSPARHFHAGGGGHLQHRPRSYGGAGRHAGKDRLCQGRHHQGRRRRDLPREPKRRARL